MLMSRLTEPLPDDPLVNVRAWARFCRADQGMIALCSPNMDFIPRIVQGDVSLTLMSDEGIVCRRREIRDQSWFLRFGPEFDKQVWMFEPGEGQQLSAFQVRDEIHRHGDPSYVLR